MRSKRLLSFLLLVPILLLAVSTDPLREAKALYAKGEWTKAAETLLRWRASSPGEYGKSEEGDLLLGKAYLKGGERAEEGAALLEGIYRKKGVFADPEPLFLLYRHYQGNNESQGRFYLKAAFNLFPGDPAVLAEKLRFSDSLIEENGDWSQALFYLVDLQNRGWERSHPEILLAFGKAYALKRSYPLAAQYFALFFRRVPSLKAPRAMDLFLAGLAFYHTGRREQSVPLFVRFFNVFPDHPRASEALILAGAGFYGMGKYKMAALFFSTQMSHFPKDPFASEAKLGLADSLSHLSLEERNELPLPYFLKEGKALYRSILKESTSIGEKHKAYGRILDVAFGEGALAGPLKEYFQFLKAKGVDPEGEVLYRQNIDRLIERGGDDLKRYFSSVGGDTRFLSSAQRERMKEAFRTMGESGFESMLVSADLEREKNPTKRKELRRRLMEIAFSSGDKALLEKRAQEFQREFPREPLPVAVKRERQKSLLREGKKEQLLAMLLADRSFYIGTPWEKENELLLFRLQVEASRWKDVLQTFGLLEKRKDLTREERQSLLVPVVTALLKVGERGRAEKYLQEALRGPSDKRDWVLFQLGSLFVERGEKEKGRDYWNRLSREFPESFWSRQARLALESGL